MASHQDNLGFLITDVARLMRRTFAARLQGSALTLAQARALIHVARHEGVRQVELAEFLEVQPITLARLLDQLGDAGLVERRPDPDDRRAYRIYLKPAAAPRLAAIEAVGASIRADGLRNLNRQESALVMSTLRKMRDNLSPR
ncbi:MAG: MarR family transcriptional regulator [Burkholderiaceae bacterium]